MSKSTPGKLDRDNARREREMGRDRQAEGKVEVYLANATQGQRRHRAWRGAGARR